MPSASMRSIRARGATVTDAHAALQERYGGFLEAPNEGHGLPAEDFCAIFGRALLFPDGLLRRLVARQVVESAGRGLRRFALGTLV